VAEQPEAVKAVPVRHPWRWVAAGLILLLIANAIWSLATQAQIDWSVFREFLFASTIIHGVWLTLALTAIAMVMGIALGVVLAVMWMSPNPLVSGASWFYIWVFRGTPVIVQLLFWFAIAAIYPHLSIGVPFGGPEFLGLDSKNLITPFMAAIFGLGFNEAAYMAEIVRAGINSVDEGQEEAAAALGMGRLLTMRRIVLPQAMRVIIPPTGNETISMLKTSSLAAYISVSELLFNAQIIYSRNYRVIELLLVASVWYLFFTSILTVGQYYIERYFSRGSRNAPPPSRMEHFIKNFLPKRYPREEGGPPASLPKHFAPHD
jgi:polar amino acid transport system permease protein